MGRAHPTILVNGDVKMTFWNYVIATLIGTTAGFLFSLAFFWLKERVKQNYLTKNLIINLKYELEYNLNLFKKYSIKVSECIEAINSGKKDVYLNLDYNFVSSYFSIQFYREGLTRKYLHYEDLKRWNDIVSNHSAGSEKYVMDAVESWRKTEIEKEKVFSALKHERDQLNYAIEMIEYLKAKIQ